MYFSTEARNISNDTIANTASTEERRPQHEYEGDRNQQQKNEENTLENEQDTAATAGSVCSDRYNKYCVRTACSLFRKNDEKFNYPDQFVHSEKPSSENTIHEDFQNMTATYQSNVLQSFRVQNYGEDASPFPKTSIPRKRWVGRTSRIVNGVLLTQKRRPYATCKHISQTYLFGDKHSNYDTLSEGACLSNENEASVNSFGLDAFLNVQSSLYKPGIGQEFHNFFNMSDSTRFNELHVPYGFVPHGDKFYVLFDINAGIEWVDNMLTYLKDGYFLDDHTQELSLYVELYNPQLHNYVLHETVFKFQKSGYNAVSSTTDIIDLTLYLTDKHSISRYICEILVVAFIVIDFLGEAKQYFFMMVKNRDFFSYFYDDKWNPLDFASIWLLVYQLYLNYVHAHRISDIHPNIRYSIYKELNPGVQRANPLDMHDSHELDKLLKQKELFSGIKSDQQYLYTLTMVNMMLLLLRLLKSLDFQPRIVLITSTIRAAASNLFHFFILFGTLLAMFAFVAQVSFGQISSSFSRFDESAMTLFGIITGSSDIHGVMRVSELSVLWLVFYYSYLVINVFVMYNILLAIIVDGYAEITDVTCDASTIGEDVKSMFHSFGAWLRKPKEYLSDEELLNLLNPVRLETTLDKKEERVPPKDNKKKKSSAMVQPMRTAKVAKPIDGTKSIRLSRYMADENRFIHFQANKAFIKKLLLSNGTPPEMIDEVIVELMSRVQHHVVDTPENEDEQQQIESIVLREMYIAAMMAQEKFFDQEITSQVKVSNQTDR